MRHGFGVRASAPFGMASHYRPNKAIRASLTSLRSVNDTNGGGGGAPPAADHQASERRDRRIDDGRGGFVLKARSDEQPQRRNSLVEKTKRGLLSVRSVFVIKIKIVRRVDVKNSLILPRVIHLSYRENK